MKSMVSITMKAGTRRTVTSVPFRSPIPAPGQADDTEGHDPEVKEARREEPREDHTRSPSIATERSRSLLTMTKVIPTAMMPTLVASRSTAWSAPVEPKNAGLT